eukprot:Gb_25451 [translate_table: standard]
MSGLLHDLSMALYPVILVAWIHKELMKTHQGLLTIVVPRHPQRGNEITLVAYGSGCSGNAASSLPSPLPVSKLSQLGLISSWPLLLLLPGANPVHLLVGQALLGVLGLPVAVRVLALLVPLLPSNSLLCISITSLALLIVCANICAGITKSVTATSRSLIIIAGLLGMASDDPFIKVCLADFPLWFANQSNPMFLHLNLPLSHVLSTLEGLSGKGINLHLCLPTRLHRMLQMTLGFDVFQFILTSKACPSIMSSWTLSLSYDSLTTSVNSTADQIMGFLSDLLMVDPSKTSMGVLNAPAPLASLVEASIKGSMLLHHTGYEIPLLAIQLPYKLIQCPYTYSLPYGINIVISVGMLLQCQCQVALLGVAIVRRKEKPLKAKEIAYHTTSLLTCGKRAYRMAVGVKALLASSPVILWGL